MLSDLNCLNLKFSYWLSIVWASCMLFEFRLKHFSRVCHCFPDNFVLLILRKKWWRKGFLFLGSFGLFWSLVLWYGTTVVVMLQNMLLLWLYSPPGGMTFLTTYPWCPQAVRAQLMCSPSSWRDSGGHLGHMLQICFSWGKSIFWQGMAAGTATVNLPRCTDIMYSCTCSGSAPHQKW